MKQLKLQIQFQTKQVCCCFGCINASVSRGSPSCCMNSDALWTTRSLSHCCISATLYQYECNLNVLTMLLYSNCHNYAQCSNFYFHLDHSCCNLVSCQSYSCANKLCSCQHCQRTGVCLQITITILSCIDIVQYGANLVMIHNVM